MPENLNCSIDDDKPLEELRQKPLSLPDAFEWDTLDITDSNIVSIN